MFQLSPTPKQQAKLSRSSGKLSISIPDRWEDFAPLLTIKSGKGYAKFDPYPFQVEINSLIDRYRLAMLAKGRQQGISEFCLSKILHLMLTNEGFNAVCISKTGLDSYKLGNRMITMLDSIELPTRRKSSAEIVLINGSRVVFTFPGATASVGEMSVGLILIDEASKIRELELTIGAAMPATSLVEDPIVLIVFTPNGKSHYSFELLNSGNPPDFDLITKILQIRQGIEKPLFSWVDLDGWCKILLHWRAHPIYSKSETYLLDTSRKLKMSWKKVLREYDLSFDEAENQWLDDVLIDSCATAAYEPEPRENVSYFAGLDSSSVGSDYFSFAVLMLEGDRLSLVHLYRNRRKTMKRHLRKILELLDLYDCENTAVETNSFGALYLQELSDERSLMNFTGFNAGTNSNIRLFDDMLAMMEEGKLSYTNEPIVLRELRGLEECPKTGKIEAAKQSLESDSEYETLHDDIPRSIALAIYAYKNRPYGGRIKGSVVKKIMDS